MRPWRSGINSGIRRPLPPFYLDVRGKSKSNTDLVDHMELDHRPIDAWRLNATADRRLEFGSRSMAVAPHWSAHAIGPN